MRQDIERGHSEISSEQKRSERSGTMSSIAKSLAARIAVTIGGFMVPACAANIGNNVNRPAFVEPSKVESSRECNDLRGCAQKMAEIILDMLMNKKGTMRIAFPYFKTRTVSHSGCPTGEKAIRVNLAAHGDQLLDNVWNQLPGKRRVRGQEAKDAALSTQYTHGENVNFGKVDNVVATEIVQSGTDSFDLNVIVYTIENGQVTAEQSKSFTLSLRLDGTDTFIPQSVEINIPVEIQSE